MTADALLTANDVRVRCRCSDATARRIMGDIGIVRVRGRGTAELSVGRSSAGAGSSR